MHNMELTQSNGFPPLKRPAKASLLCEVSWEVCQQVGGIYTVIRSKIPSMIEAWGDAYCTVGPWDPKISPAEFEETPPDGIFAEAIKRLRVRGFEVHHGYWLVTGRPRTILLTPGSVFGRLGEIKYFLWDHHRISIKQTEPLIDQVLAFGFLVEQLLGELAAELRGKPSMIAHFHEWMAGTAIPELRRTKVPLAMVFTTHATMLGRYLAMNDPAFYDRLPRVNWETEAIHFNIDAQVRLERAAAHGCHVFTTLSDVTAEECKFLLGRAPDILVPNGLNIERFVALHEFQNLHRTYKDKISQFVMSHFFPHYSFDLDKTLYFFSSGRYEYRNKGFDMTIEALARLNWRMKQAGDDRTVVFFLVTRRPNHSYLPQVLHSRGAMEEIRDTCESIKNQIGERLFLAASKGGEWPKLDSLVDDYWRMRLRRMQLAWKRDGLPPIVTHHMLDPEKDEVINQLRGCQLLNRAEDPVKVVYHADFISSTLPIFGIDYDHFVRGCHLGIFPSAYEPWGYTPLECLARGVPSVTSDLSGFGTYLLKHLPNHADCGGFVSRRRFFSFNESTQALTDWLFEFCGQSRRDRIAQRNRAENLSTHFDWRNLGQNYIKAYDMATQRL